MYTGKIDNMEWFVYALLSTSLYAFIPILDKINCSRVDPMIIATLSSILSSIFLVFYCGFEKKFIHHMPQFSYTDCVCIVATAMLTALSWAFYYGAIKIGPVSKITTFDSFSFVLTILFSSLILNEAIAMHTMLGIMIIMCGVYIMVL